MAGTPNTARSSGFEQGATVPPLLGSFQSCVTVTALAMAPRLLALPGSLGLCVPCWIFAGQAVYRHHPGCSQHPSFPQNPRARPSTVWNTHPEGLRLSWQQREPPPPAGERGRGRVTSTQIPHPGHGAKEAFRGNLGRRMKAQSLMQHLSSRGLHGLPCGHLADGPAEECNELCRWEVPRSGCSRGAGSQCFVYKHRQDD